MLGSSEGEFDVFMKVNPDRKVMPSVLVIKDWDFEMVCILSILLFVKGNSYNNTYL